MRRADDPSGFRGRGRRRRRHPQQQCGDAGGLGCQCELAAGDEIELARLAPDFQYHGAERIAGKRVGAGAQRGLGIGRAHGDDQARIEAELAKPAHRQRAGFELGKILPHPDQRFSRRNPSRETCDKAGCRRTLMPFGKHFMHRGDSQAAAQHRIRARVSKRDPVERMRIAIRLEALDAAAQRYKRACACAAHRAAPFGRWWPASVQGEPEAGSFVHDMF
jgi:hypothetical protein